MCRPSQTPQVTMLITESRVVGAQIRRSANMAPRLVCISARAPKRTAREKSRIGSTPPRVRPECATLILLKNWQSTTARFWRRARGPKFNFLCSLFKQNNVERGGVSGLPELPPTLHRSSHFTMSALESSSTGSSFPAVLAKSVPLAAASLDSE